MTRLLSKRKSSVVAVLTCTVLATAILAIKFFSHKGVWLLGLTASIPLLAAIVGGIPERNDGDQG